MKKAVIAAVLSLLLVTTLRGVALCEAQKLGLRENPHTWGVPDPTSAWAGFVILNNDNEADEVVVVVSLKKGVADRTYGVFLEEYKSETPDGSSPQWTYLGDLTTNIQDKGNFYARVSRSADTCYLQIVVSYPWGSWGAQSFGTDIATVTIE